MMSTLYGEPLLFKSKYVCNRSGSIQAPSSTTKVEDVLTESENLFWNMSVASETANCNFTGITHISENFQIFLAHKEAEI